MILVLDNYDSFVHNLARYFRRLGHTTEIVRSDRVSVEDCANSAPAAIVISPGPRRPENAGISLQVVRQLGATIPILGVCLGHQTIGQAFGARIIRCEGVHGRASELSHDGTGLFHGCRAPMKVGRYHSLAIDEATLPKELIATARTIACDQPSVIMAVQHTLWPIYGVQFHPESVLTEEGSEVLSNFLRLALAWRDVDAQGRTDS